MDKLDEIISQWRYDDDYSLYERGVLWAAIAQALAAERQAAALERIAAVLEYMSNKGDGFLSVGVLK